MLCENYNYIKQTAFEDNLMTYINGKIYDEIRSPWDSPYDRSTLFAVCPVTNYFKTGNLSFVLSPDRIVQNVSSDLNDFMSFEIDFGTGSGFQTYYLNQTINVSLPAGKHHATVLVKRPWQYGNPYKCRFDIEVAQSSEPLPESGGPDDFYRESNSDEEFISAVRNQDGNNFITAKVTTFYACSDKKLRKPLFILDGFNSGSDTDARVDWMDSEVFLKFFNGYSNTPISTATNRRAVTQELRREGYDLIFVNWRSEDGRDDLRRSATLLQKIITIMNGRKADAKSVEKNVVIGISMGGVIAKYAILDFERKNPTTANGGHDVKLFVSYDSPMQGANIALGFQYMVKDLGEDILFSLGSFVPQLKKGLATLKSPAARQLLTYQAFDATTHDPVFFKDFYTELNGMGKPQKCDYKTVSNGSVVGTANFSAGKQILGGRIFVPIGLAFAVYLSLDVRALPTTSSTKTTIYDRTLIGFVRIFGVPVPLPVLPRRTVKIENMRPLDGCPGGTTGLSFNLNLLAFGGIKSGRYDDGNGEDLRCTFIPTVSALDIQTTNVFLNVSNQLSLVTSGFVGSRGSAQFDAARFIEVEIGQNRAANQVHAGLSNRTTGFLLYELITRNTLQSTSTTSNVLLNNRTYNFASSSAPYPNNLPQPTGFQPRSMTNIIDYTLDVDNTGQLWVNRAGRIGFTNDATSPSNAGTNTSYSLIIRQGEGCRSGTDINPGIVNITKTTSSTTGGIVLIGDASTPTNAANIRIMKGGTMNIAPGGTVILENTQSYISIEDGGLMTLSGTLELKGLQSKVIIKSGGKLVINTGSNINFTGNNPSITIESGGEIVFNGNPTIFAGTGSFVFMPDHILKLNTNLKLKGAGKTIPLVYLSSSTLGGLNTLKIIESSIEIENAQIKYDVNCKIEIKHSNSPLQSVKFTDVSFLGTSFVNTRAVNCINTPNVSFTGCDFNNLLDGVGINCNNNISLRKSVQFSKCNFTSVNNGINIKDVVNAPQGGNSLVVVDCNFSYTSLFPNSNIPSIGCKFENTSPIIFYNTNIFTGSRQGTSWRDYTAIDLSNSRISNYGARLLISDFKTGINSNLGFINLLSGFEIRDCETGINSNGGSVSLYCSKLTNNLTGIKGTDIKFGGSDGRDIGSGNEFSSAPNGLLFDMFYPTGVPGINLANFRASNNFWSGQSGFDNTRFRIFTGLCAGCTTLNNSRLSIEQCSENSAVCQQVGVPNCCGQNIKTSNGLISNISIKQCATGGGGGTSDALVMRKPATPQSSPNVKELEDSDVKSFLIYPNPANETVKLDIESGNYTLKVLNTVGQTIFAQNTEGSLSVDVSKWTNGIYLFEVTDKATNKRQRSKIVVQH
jgi:Secretion system C-terminal sorting domain